MKKFFFFLLLLSGGFQISSCQPYKAVTGDTRSGIAGTGAGRATDALNYAGPSFAGFWLYPFMNETQADQMVDYDILIIHNEIVYQQSPMIDRLLEKNRKLKLIVYFNATEWFVPAYEDSPWAIKMVKELSSGEYADWWLKQPNGKPVTFWTGTDGRKTNLMDMRLDAKNINGQAYCEFIAERFCADILKDKRIAGVEIDNAWPNSYWLGRYGANRGVDFDRDRKPDSDSLAIDRSWKEGQSRLIKTIRRIKGDDFIIIANPGTLAFNIDLNGKILENWPFEYAGDTTNGGWNISMSNATKFGPFTILNARPGNWFFTLCSAMLLENAYFSDIQNSAYQDKYKINLGRPLEGQGTFKKNLPLYSRRFEKGTVFVSPQKKEAWIEDNDGHLLYGKTGEPVKR